MEVEKQPNNIIRNGEGEMIRLPIGYRFHPTDVELVLHYLKRKVYSIPLPASVIPDSDVFHTHPCDLAGNRKEKRYFFSKRKGDVKKYRRTCCGYWKVIGKDKVVVDPATNQPIGMKKSMVFYQGKRPHASRSPWFMNQYRLVPSPTTLNSTQMEDWVVSRIYEKKSKGKNGGAKKGRNVEASIMDLMMEDNIDIGPPQPSSSSGITKASCNGLLDQEACSGYSNFASYDCVREEGF